MSNVGSGDIFQITTVKMLTNDIPEKHFKVHSYTLVILMDFKCFNTDGILRL